MSDGTKVGCRTVHRPCFQVGVGRTPQAQVHEWTFAARLKKLFLLRTHILNRWDEIMPGVSERTRSQIISGSLRTERRAQPEYAVVTNIKTSIAGVAVKQVITAMMSEFIVD